MRKSNVFKLLAIVVCGTTMMYAQATRTWVSGVGDDANPCSRTAPCKTFAGAISKTAPGGEIDALDPGGFGALTITKSITLDGGGGQVASVLVAGTNGIVVAAGATDNVIIRNLRLDGLRGGGNANAGLHGISFISGNDLNIENCVIFGFNNNGVNIALNQNSAASVHIINTVIKNVGGSGVRATNAQAPAVQVGIENSYAILDAIGFEAAQHSALVVHNSVAENGTTAGMKAADGGGTSDARLTVSDSVASFNADGIQANTGSAVVVGGSVVFLNSGCGFNGAGGATVFYYGAAAGSPPTNRLGNNTGGNLCGLTMAIPQL